MPVFESSRKVQVFGCSLALTLPAFFVNTNQVEKGSLMNVHYGLDGVLVLPVLHHQVLDGGLLLCQLLQPLGVGGDLGPGHELVQLLVALFYRLKLVEHNSSLSGQGTW